MKKILIIIAAVSASITIGLGVNSYLTNYSKSSQNTSNESSQSSTNIATSKKYVEVSTDRIGEYSNNKYFSRASIEPIEISSIGKLNFYNTSYKEQFKTVDFSNSDIKPFRFDVNGFKFLHTEVFLNNGNPSDVYSSYEKISADKYTNLAKGLKLELYKSDYAYYLIAQYNDGFYWSLSNSYSDKADEAIAEQEFKQALQCISTEYDATAPLAEDFIGEYLYNLDFGVASFDLNQSEIELANLDFILQYIQLSHTDKYRLFGSEQGVHIRYNDNSLSMSISSMNNLGSTLSVEDVKNNTNKVYDTKINDKNVRIYQNSDDKIVYLGIITGSTEQIITTSTTNFSIDTFIEFLELTMK